MHAAHVLLADLGCDLAGLPLNLPVQRGENSHDRVVAQRGKGPEDDGRLGRRQILRIHKRLQQEYQYEDLSREGSQELWAPRRMQDAQQCMCSATGAQATRGASPWSHTH